jgi:tetratricopeptide (TPR) repeat protein
MENSRAYLFYSALFVIVAVLLLGSLWKIWPIWFPPSQEMSAAALLDASKAIHTLILDGATTQTRGDFVKANAHYSKALSEAQREARIERYLTVKTASDDKFDPMVAVKYNMLLNNLSASGRYKEKLEWMPKANEYFRRDPSFRNDKDAQQIAIALTHMMMGDVSEGEALLPSWIKERQFQDVSANSNV